MPMSETLETRIVEMEIRLAHQDDTLQTLNRLVIDQQQQIESLKHQVENLRLRLMEVMQAPEVDPSLEPPPPHY
jgi:SlyX protein